MSILITSEDIYNGLDKEAISLGEQLVKQGRVLKYAVAKHGRSVSSITKLPGRQGTCTQRVRLIQNYDDSWTIEGKCTCNKRFNCEHVAATLLLVVTKDGGGRNRWRDAIQRQRKRPSNLYNGEWHIVYALETGKEGNIQLKPLQTRILADGHFSKPINISYTNILSGKAKAAILSHDRKIAQCMSNTKDDVLVDDFGAIALENAISRGVLFGSVWEDKIKTKPLNRGPNLPLMGNWLIQNEKYRLFLNVKDRPTARFIPTAPNWYFDSGTQTVGIVKTSISFATLDILKKLPVLSKEEFNENALWLAEHVPESEKWLDDDIRARRLEVKPRGEITPIAVMDDDISRRVALDCRFFYGEEEINQKHKEQAIVVREDGSWFKRDFDAEKRLKDELERYDLSAIPDSWIAVEGDDLKGWPLQSRMLEVARWQQLVKDAGTKHQWKIDEFAKGAPAIVKDKTLEMKVSKGEENWTNQAVISVEGIDGTFDTREILDQEWNTERIAETLYLEIKTDQWIEIPKQLREPLIALTSASRKSDNYWDGTDWQHLERTSDSAEWHVDKETRSLWNTLRKLANPKAVTPPSEFKATLRPYQAIGVGWLQALTKAKMGAILADDMGLGKTIQLLGHFAVEYEKNPSILVLVVAPTSVIANWHAECSKHTPHIPVHVHHGQQRARKFELLPKKGIILTTYPLLGRDIEILSAIRCDVMVLDEAQYVRNPTAQVHKAAHEIKTKQVFCVTGTPLENHLGDVWSLMSLAVPGFLGSKPHFNHRYQSPIEKYENHKLMDQLRDRLTPIMLRRTKDAVLDDLPPSTVINVPIILEGDQREFYDSLRAELHENVKHHIKEHGQKGASIIILEALLKLRQICCDPHLVDDERAKSVEQSAKRDHLTQMVQELIEGGRRILIFSQFVSMLNILQKNFKKLGIDYCVLTGQTRNRQQEIDRFRNEDVPIFFISLKAGGVGLNLTEADTVIHYDPWWNPQAENQASDRVWRIGQEKPVFIYRLLAQDTIEDRIRALQEQKSHLASALMQRDKQLTGTQENIESGELMALLEANSET